MSYQLIAGYYEDLLKNMANIALMQRVINNSFQREFDLLNEYESNNSPLKIISRDAFGYYDPFTGELEKYAFRQTSVEELKKLTLWQKNSQYCWLLTQAYEWFEKYIFDSHVLLVSQKTNKNYLSTSLSFFSSKYPQIEKAEKTTVSRINLKVALLMIEQLRHQIVHVQGNVKNFDEFSKKIIDRSGVNNDKLKHKEFFQQFVLHDKVYLLERPISDDCRLNLYHDIFTHLVSYLIGYSRLVKNSV
ncbi:hypothetical protein ACFOEE_01300 [Pseudoalteromonas fenneropenaei]|uniref:Uncharacterized protein n=1 Tax=Pseudoalteromonas fenneropenaei TaxID=1737459 RepID=A0ABV7CEY6_9GAMM